MSPPETDALKNIAGNRHNTLIDKDKPLNLCILSIKIKKNGKHCASYWAI